ncbi:hypothetical protein FSST1_012345 [Fusarium sambucinum]
MTKHQKNDNPKPKARASSAPYPSSSRAPSGQQQQQEQQEAAPAAKLTKAPRGSLAEAENKIAHFNEFVLQNMANKTILISGSYCRPPRKISSSALKNWRTGQSAWRRDLLAPRASQLLTEAIQAKEKKKEEKEEEKEEEEKEKDDEDMINEC